MAIENQSNTFLIECAWKKAQGLFLRINKHTQGLWHFYKFYLTFFKVFLSLILLNVIYNLELQS